MRKNSFDKMCKVYYEKIYRYVWVSTNSKEKAEDITQEVFLIAYEKGQDFLNHEKPLAFLYTTARNLVHESYRENKKCMVAEIHENAIVSQEEDLAEYICNQEDKEIEIEPYAKEIIKNLSEDKQRLYQLYYVEHKSMREIAKEIGINEVTLRMRYVRLRKEIKINVKNLLPFTTDYIYK